jgi:hypothetical protein
MTKNERSRRRGEICLCLALPAGLALLLLLGAARFLQDYTKSGQATPAVPPVWLKVK